MRRAAAIVAAAAVSWVSLAAAEPVTPARRERNRRLVHLGITVIAGGAWVGSETVWKPGLAPDRCRWCSLNGFDREVRDAVVWDNVDRARSISDATAFFVSPAAALGLLAFSSDDPGDWVDDALPVVEATALQAVLNQMVKFSVGRQRPFVRYAGAEHELNQDDNLSFYSGHASTAFAIATSAATVAHLRDYRLEPAFWAVGLTLAGATSYLRMAGDKHYASDVLVGAAVGSAIGIAVPRFLHPRLTNTDLAILPTSSGGMIVGSF